MGKRSKLYSSSKHGTGWPSGHPTDAEINFLDNQSVTNQDKVKFIVGQGAKAPSILGHPTPLAVQSKPAPKTTTEQEEEAIPSGTITSHYLINWLKTGFPTRTFQHKNPKIVIP